MDCHGWYHGVCHEQNRSMCSGHNRGICRKSAMGRCPCRGNPRIFTVARSSTHRKPQKCRDHCRGPSLKSQGASMPTGHATQHPGYMEYALRPCKSMLCVTCQGMDTYVAVQAGHIHIYTLPGCGECNTLRVCHANTLLRWYRPVQGVLPHRVCDPSPWEHEGRVSTQPVYVVRCLPAYGYSVYTM